MVERQMSLFEPIFDDRIRRVEIDGETWFSVLDVFQHYGYAKNPTTSWRTALNHLLKQGFDQTREILEWRNGAENGGRKTPYAKFKTFLRIAQVAEIKEWESIREWMAEVAHERIEEIRNPELGVKRATTRYLKARAEQGESAESAMAALPMRIKAIDTFKALMATVQQICTDSPQYGQLVDTEYMGLFRATATELKNALVTKSVRDSLSPLQLSYLETTERSIEAILKNAARMSMGQIKEVARRIAGRLGEQLREIEGIIGMA